MVSQVPETVTLSLIIISSLRCLKGFDDVCVLYYLEDILTHH